MKKSTPFEYQKTAIEEIWKDIKGYEGLYQVSSFGNIKSLSCAGIGSGNSKKGKFLKPQETKKGYLQIGLYKNNKGRKIKIHTIVCSHFNGEKPALTLEVNHKDFNRKNNFFKNLCWETHKFNLEYSKQNIKRGINHHMYGKTGKNHFASRPVLSFDKKIGGIIHHDSIADAIRYFKINNGMSSTISRAIRKNYYAWDKKWKYA